MSNMVLVLDLGDGRGSAVARRMRNEQVYSEMLPANAPIETIRQSAPMGILIVGDGAEEIPAITEITQMGVPVLAMGHGARLLLRVLGGSSTPIAFENKSAQVKFEPCTLFDGLGESERFFERLDALELPEGVRAIATTEEGRVAAFSMEDRIFGLQFYVEQNDPDGYQILRNFARSVCRCEPLWKFDRYAEESIQQVRAQAGNERVILAVSGGVDSVVSAALMSKALGENLVCLHVDTGLTRKGEIEITKKCLEPLGIALTVVDAHYRFIECLKGVSATARKTELVDIEILRVLEEQARARNIRCLGFGVNYSDVLGGAAMMDHVLTGESPFKILIEPVKRLFKEEVRQAADALGLPQELIQRPSFPTAGLALRMSGPVTRERLSILRESDAIFCEEIQKAGLEKRIRQYFAVLLETQTLSADGDWAGYTLVLRAMNGANAFRLPYDLLERVTERVTGEKSGICRVVYDVTGNPPAPVEWESN